jgi:copper(I)-binding protein
MRPLTVLPIPPGASVHLERGGKHLMLMRPTGQSEQVELNFMSGDTILMGVTSRITQRKP